MLSILPVSNTGISKVASACGTQRRLTHSRLTIAMLNISAGIGAVSPPLSRAAPRKPARNCAATGGHEGVEIDQRLDAVRHAVGDAGDDHAAIGMADQDDVVQLLRFDAADD